MSFIKMVFRALSVVLLLQTVFANPINSTQSTDELKQKCANLREINGNYFLLDETKAISGLPAEMRVDWKSGDIYYTHITSNGEMAVHVINKQTGQERTISVPSAQSTAIDNTNHIVYVVGENGVYKLKDDGSPEPYAASGKDVVYVAVTKDGRVMYIATYPNNQVYKITDDGKTMEKFPAIPDGRGLTIDGQGNIFFIESVTTYVLKAGHTTPDEVDGIPGKILDLNVIKEGDEVFGMDQNSHWYNIDGDKASATYWGSFGVTEVNAFAQDDLNNMYIGVNGTINIFKYYENNPCTVSQGINKRVIT